MLVARRGFEPLISWLRTTHPRPLDERAMSHSSSYRFFTRLASSMRDIIIAHTSTACKVVRVHDHGQGSVSGGCGEEYGLAHEELPAGFHWVQISD